MKLSTAIRIGSMTTKHITGNLTDGGNGRCALGAAADASGIGMDYFSLNRRFPLLDRIVKHPVNGFDCRLSEWIYTTNDHGLLSREQIADHVEQIENEAEHDGYISTNNIESKPLELIAMEAK